MSEGEKLFSVWRKLTYALVGILTGILAIHALFTWLFPFTAAFFASFLLYPLSKRLGKRTKMSHSLLRVFLMLILVGTASLLLLFGILRLVDEIKDFFLTFYENVDTLATTVLDFLERLKEKIPLSSNIPTETVSAFFKDSLKNAVSALSARSAEAAAKLAAKLPHVLFSLLIFLLAFFYFSLDYERVCAYLSSLVPPRFHRRLSAFRQSLTSALKGYFRAYFFLFLITFSELFLAFLLLRVGYAFLLALTAAALDILPAIGVGILLIPWGIFLLIQGNTAKAIALFSVYLGVTVLRQFIEPRILGKELGLHPLVSLAALYVGFRFFGMLGILLSPFVALAAAKLIRRYREALRSHGADPPC